MRFKRVPDITASRCRWLGAAGVMLLLVGCMAYAQPATRRRIREWTKLLQSDDPQKRSSAATSLLSTDDADALETLLEAMRPKAREEVRVSIITAFGVKGDDRATRELITALEDQSNVVRDAAAVALQSTYTPQAVFLMEKVIANHDVSPQTRGKVITILGEMRAMDSIPALIAVMADKDATVRKAAASALERITLRRFDSVGEWQAWWRRSEQLSREEMLEELVALQAERILAMSRRLEELDLRVLRDRKDPKDPTLLLEALDQSPSHKVRQYAIQQLSALQGKAVVEALIKALADSDGTVREKAVEALGAQGDVAAAPHIAAILNDPIGPARAAAARSLGFLKAGDSVPALCALLDDPTEIVAAAAARALGDIALADSVPSLIKVVAKPETPPKVQEEAANALAKIKDPRATPTLVRLLVSPQQNLRWAAVDALGEMRAQEAGAPLADVVQKDENPQIRELALAALAKIGGIQSLDAAVAGLADKEKRVAEQALRSVILLAEADNALYAEALDRLVAARRYALAEEVLAKAMEYYNAKPNHAQHTIELRVRLARGLVAAKAWTEARPHLEALVSTVPGNVDHARNLAQCLLALKDRSAYIALLRQAVETFPEEGHWWAEWVRVIGEFAAEDDPAQIVKLVDLLEKAHPNLGGDASAKALRELRDNAKAKLAPAAVAPVADAPAEGKSAP